MGPVPRARAATGDPGRGAGAGRPRPAPRIVLLSGPRGSGKTQACLALVAQVRARGGRVGGIVSPARLERGRTVAIDALAVAEDQRRPLAWRVDADAATGGDPQHSVVHGGWRFDRGAFAWANEVLSATPTACDVVVVDEVGPLELVRHDGFTAALALPSDAGHALIVIVVRPELLDAARRRWPTGEVATPETLWSVVGDVPVSDASGSLPTAQGLAPAIDLRDVTVTLGGRPALCGLTLLVEPGRFVLVSGPSGCGKSTLARLIAGLTPSVMPAVVGGAALVDGVDPATTGPAAMARHVGTVFQDPAAQLFCLTVEEELAFGPRNLGCSAGDTAERVDWAAAVCSVEHLRRRPPASLSGGEQQRVATAAVLAMRPRVLVLDEPLARLDARGARDLLATLRQINREQDVTVVLMEHRLVEASTLADRLVLLERGRVVADGCPDTLLADRPLVRRLGLRRPTIEPFSDWEDLVRPAQRAGDAPPLLEARDITAGYGHARVLRNLSLTLHSGEVLALVGENGSGKSTLARVLAGVKRPERGTVTLAGIRRPRPGIDIGLLLQDPAEQLLTDTVDAEVSLGPRARGLFDHERHEALLEIADLAQLRHFAPLSLSAGQQQRTVLAAALALHPRVVILDEPTVGQDWSHLERLVELLRRLTASGSAILLITHDFKLAHHCADRVAILRDGVIARHGVFVRAATAASLPAACAPALERAGRGGATHVRTAQRMTSP